MARLYVSEVISGVANSTIYGLGITSTEVEPKRLIELIITVSSRANNYVEGWLEREKKMSIVDYNLPLDTDVFRLSIPIDDEIPVGRTWKVALRCGGTATQAYVTYVYEIAA